MEGSDMGFPSPAQDYMGEHISFDQLFEMHRPGTYVVQHAFSSVRECIKSGARLVVEMGAKPCDGSLVVCVIDGQFRIKRLRLHPSPRLEHLDRLNEVILLNDDAEPVEIRGVVKYVVNDARTGEFDDTPVM